MTIATGDDALAADVAAINTLATSALTAAGTASANAATALSNSVAAQATAAEAVTAASLALSVGALPVVTTAAGTNTIPIGQGETTVAITLANLLGGETIDLLGGAGAASDTDTFMVGQGSNILVAQTMAAVWAYLQGKLPNYRFPVQEIAGSITIDGTYAGKILVVTGAGVTLSPNYGLMGSGFECEVMTAGGGTVLWGAGITSTNAANGMSTGQYAKLIAATSSVGNVVLACVGAASVSGVAAPGAITGLTLGAVTATSIAFSWTAPSGGSAATFYQVQSRVYGSGSAWATLSPNPTTTAATITGLSSGVQYDVQVAANNTGGVPSSYVDYAQSPVAATTAAAAPGVPSGLATSSVASTSVGLAWTAPSTGGAVATYSVQWSLHGANSWSTVSPAPTVASASITGLTASTYYDFQVAGVNSGSTVGSYDQLLNVLTSAPAAYAPNVPTSVAAGTITSTSVAVGWTASAVDGSHSAAASYLVAYSSNAGSTYSTPVNVGNVTTHTFVGLTASTAYVFEVAASNSVGNSSYVTVGASTIAASGSGAPNVVTSLAAGTVTSYTVPLTWTAPATDGSHSAATNYTVQYRISGSAIYATASSSVTGTSYTVTGLIAGQTYQFNVFGTNSSGAGAGATVTGTPTASGLTLSGWGSGGYPNHSYAAGTTGIALVTFLSAGTNVASCQFGFSPTQFDLPTAPSAGTVYSSTVYGTLGAIAPASAGTYYGWMLFFDAGGDCILAIVGTTGQDYVSGGGPITAAVTVT